MTGGPDLVLGQQAAEEQVPVGRQALAQPAGVLDQAAGVGQLVHPLTITTTSLAALRHNGRRQAVNTDRSGHQSRVREIAG